MDATWDKMKANGTWGLLGRLITWVLQIVVIAVVIWAKNNFVTRDEYQKDSKETLIALIQVGKDMQKVSDKLEGYESITKHDVELEGRIRDLEKQLWKGHP